MVAKIGILRNYGCANLHFAQTWWSTYVEPPHVEAPHSEASHVEAPHIWTTMVAKICILRNHGGPHMWSLHMWSLHMWSLHMWRLHMWSLHMDFLANLIKFARCLANYNNFARSPCKFEKKFVSFKTPPNLQVKITSFTCKISWIVE